ncbi:RHS repeat-associated core domain-containing protein [Chryseolinea serpens]|uniref:RHS repeat-associated core domain-containing protein n=1 Tax=Chryseolinea serpens TaxID=947013 RepID=A0A1M5LDK1_9BACT|nr:RHS repeat-associated core domain-containing protein [Chryseolinea serpens]SHG63097.1 RHS repeat-associated core domain-containing protein [Chryseolinea serpens]
MKRTLHIFLACISLTLFGTLQAQTLYPIQWINVAGATVNADNTLTKVGANGWTSGAASSNLLYAGVDGSVQFTYTGPSTAYYMVGLSRTDKDVNYNSIEYGIAYSNGVISVIQSGASVSYGAPQANEVFKVVRTGNTIYYYRSSSATPMTTTTLSNIYNSTFRVDVSVYSGTMPAVQASFDVALNISASVTPVSYGGINGGISLSVTQGTAPYTYSWNTGETTSTITGKTVGPYTATVTDAVGHVTTKTVSIGYKPNWTNLVGGVAVDVNKNLVKTGANAWDAGASSYNILPRTTTNGWIEFAWTSSQLYEIGLSRRDPDVLTSSLEYGFYITNGDIDIFELGTNLGTFGRAASGDIFRIVKNGAAVEYYHNGMLLRSVTYATLDADFLVDVSVYHNGTAVPAIYTSFDSRLTIKKTITPVQSASAGGSIQVTPSGGMPPYTYSWDVGGNTDQVTNKPAGSYKVTVTDAEGRTGLFNIGLGYEIDWTYLNAATVQVLSNGSIQRYSATSAWDGGASSLNMLLPNTDGWVEFEIERATGSYFEIGLSTGDINYSYTGTDNGIMANSDGNVYFFKKSANQGAIGLNRATDVYRIARETTGPNTASLNIYRNGVVAYTTAIGTSIPQVVDVTVLQGKTPVIYSSFDTRLRVLPTIRPLDANGNNASIGLTVTGGTAPSTITWSPTESGPVLSGKDMGQYTATITDHAGRTLTRSYRTGYPIEWGSLVNASRESSYSLRKSSTNVGWDAGAFSHNTLAANTAGWIEFVAPPVFGNILWAVGLSATNANASFASIAYAFVFGSSGNTVYIYENGTYKASAGYWFAGDVFTITRTQGGAMAYFVNGQQVYTSATVNTQNLFVDAAIYSPGMTIPTVVGSFKRELTTVDQTIRNNWAFEYRYDERQRMIAKKVPGADWIYMAYDNRDRLVLTQDGNQRVTNEWSYTKYDVLNRPITTGLYKHTGNEATQAEMQGYVNTQYQTLAYYEDYDGTTTLGYTTNKSFPAASTTPLTVTYYDDYKFKALYNDPRFDFVADHLDGQSTAPNDRVIGQVTGAQVRSLNDAYNWMASVNYYDDKYRVIQRVEEDHRGKISRHTSTYDFVGKVIETNSTQAHEYDVVWRAAGCRIDNMSNKLICTSGAWSGGGSSLQVLPAAQDGWVEYVYDGSSSNAVGLSATDVNYNQTSIQYGAYSLSSGKLYALGNGILAFLGDIHKSDVIRIERVKGTVLMKVNGTLYYTFATASTTSLVVDVSLGSGTLEHVQTSFGADKTQFTGISWLLFKGVSWANNTITKTAGSGSWSNAATTSQNVMSGPGWIQFKATETNTNRFVGLSSISPIVDYTNLEYSFYLASGSVLQIRENDVVKYTGTFATGDVLRIESTGSAIVYSKNGQIIPIVPPAQPSPPPTKAYRLATVLSSGTVGDVSVSFGVPLTEQKIDLYSRFEYDHVGRPLKAWQKINSDPEVLLTSNDYNELGQLITKKLYNTDPKETDDNARRFKQEVDYRYNIRGWLTRINNSDLKPDNGDGPQDLFGMELAYEQPMTSITNENQVAFNGTISAIRWSNNLGQGGTNNPTQRAYRYSYDPMNRLTSADHFEGTLSEQVTNGQTVLITTWNASNAYKESIMGTGGKSGYDLNGNILKLQRTGKDGANIDMLDYDYGSDLQRSNKLLNVADAPNTDADVRDKGFKDGASTVLDYSYDLNGNMVSDLNKDVQSITYNYLNLPTRVNKTSGEYIKYIYDANGRKLTQQVFDASNVMIKRSDYVGSLFLENGELKFINLAEGRIIPAKAKTETNEYQYHLKDHLGNIRLTFTTKDETETVLATLEPDHVDDDRANFLYYDEAILVKNNWFDHTNNTPTPEHDDPDDKKDTGWGATSGTSTRLTGTDYDGDGVKDDQYGLARSISVMPGDEVKMEVYAKYVDLAQADPNGAFTTFIQYLATAGAATTGTIVDGGAAGSLGATPMPVIPLSHADDNNGTQAPKAYLNYIFVDRDMNRISTDIGYKQITEAARESGQDGPHEYLSLSFHAKQAGYLYIYLSNDNPQPAEVYFDDFKVTQTKSPVVQQDDYYPFGLVAQSFQRENSVTQNYLYNGKEMQDELNLGVIDYGARMYMPDIGRWFGVDLKSEKYHTTSPYNYVLNNPVILVDPDGMKVEAVEGGYRYTEEDARMAYAFTVQNQHKRNVYIALVENDVLRKSTNRQAKTIYYGQWAVMAVKTAKEAAFLLTFRNSKSLDNLVYQAHGARRVGKDHETAFMTSIDFDPKDTKYAVTASRIDKYLKNCVIDEEVEAIENIMSKVKDDGNVVFESCFTASGDSGDEMLSKLLELSGSKINISSSVDLCRHFDGTKVQGVPNFNQGVSTYGPLQDSKDNPNAGWKMIRASDHHIIKYSGISASTVYGEKPLTFEP